jgi:hypothetical protein
MHSAVVISSSPQTKRQVRRALQAGEISVSEEVSSSHTTDLLLIDTENADEQVLKALLRARANVPVVMLSLGSPSHVVDLVQRFEIDNMIAKHGAARAIFPVVDERELLVTCKKILANDIFGIEKYVGAWGVKVHERTVTGMASRREALSELGTYLENLGCPSFVVPDIVTVADELLLNAIVHAPHDAAGNPKYEHIGPSPTLELELHERALLSYACDGQRLLISVRDRFGRLGKDTLTRYLSRSLENEPVSPEEKSGGAGLGLTLSFRSIHQMIFNIQPGGCTEVIAGWYLRFSRATEFRAIGKSFNVFWLPTQAELAA